jgi:tetratricopeptide (TPR) repeat protein
MTHTDSDYADAPAETFNPFPGLRPFETDEYTLFFGRDGQSDELLSRLGRTRFLAVVGTSGSGKSSLIRAGLLPALYGGLMAGAGSAWRVAIFRPGGDPVGNLAAALCSAEALGVGAGDAGVQEAIVEATLRRSTLGLVDVVRQARLAPHENLLVVVDQFEELFRFRASMEAQGSEDDAAAFVKLLLEAPQRKAREESAARRKADPDYSPPPGQEVVPVYVVLTMRSDFLGDCAQFQGLPEAINDGQYLIPRMTRDERRAAITGPAAVGGGEISLPLVNRLLNDVGDNPDQLPIMQHALMRTWEHWAARCQNGLGPGACATVELSDYEAVGGMEDALSRHADEAFNELPDERARLVAEKMFKALTEKGADNREIRRPATLAELCETAEATPEEVSSVVETFRREGRSFLMPPDGTPLEAGTVVDISHESLIRNWERLKKWVDDEAQSARIYRRVAEAATLHRAGQESLAAGAGLQAALDWRERVRPNAAWASRYSPAFAEAMSFLDESKAAHEAALAERERQREEQLARERRELEQARRFAEEQQRAARRLRRLVAAMVVMFLLSLGAAGFAFTTMQVARAARARIASMLSETEALQRATDEEREKLAVALKGKEREEQARREAEEEELRAKASEELALRTALMEKERAQKEATRANQQARLAAEREQEALKATAAARAAAAREAEAARAALAARDEAERQKKRLEVDQLGRLGLDSFQRGNYAGAEYAFQMALGMIGEKGFGQGGEVRDGDLARSQGWVLANIGSAQRKLGDYEKAIKSYQKALEIHEKVTPPASGEMFDAIHGLGHAYNDAGDEHNANQFYRRAVELLVKNPTIIDSNFELPNLETIARLYRDLGRFDEAEPYFKRVIQLRQERKNDNELADALKEVAQFYAAQNKWKEAEGYYSKLLDIQESAFNKDEFADVDFHDLAETYGDLAEDYIGLNDEPKAKAVFQLARVIQDFALKRRQVERIMAANPGEAVSPDKLKGLRMDRDLLEMADLFVRLGRFRPAETAYLQAIQFAGNDPNSEAEVMLKLGHLYRLHLKDFHKAAEAYRAAVGTLSNEGASPLLLGQALRQLGGLFAGELNRLDIAAKLFNDALQELSASPGSERAKYSTLNGLAEVYRKQNKPAEVVAVNRRKLAVAREMLATNSPTSKEQRAWDADAYAEAFGLVVRAVGDLSEAFRAKGDAESAKAVYATLLENDMDVSQVVDEKVLDAYARALEANGDYLRTMARPPSAVGSVAEQIKSARAKQGQIEQITRSQQARQQVQQTYAPPATP